MGIDIEKFWPEWHVEELIGRGTFGDVYRIRRQSGGIVTYAALKVIRIPHDESEIRAYQSQNMDPLTIRSIFEDSKDSLQEEIAIMTSLKSSLNIVSIEDYYVDEIKDGIGWVFYIRMELLQSMSSYLEDHDLGVDETVKLGTDICSALVSCSKKNVIHRDIKPENVFCNEDGEFKLGDFGIARRLEGTMSAHSKAGSPMFEAPEIARGGGYDSSVDIYSLGMMLYIYFNNGRGPFIDPHKKTITRSDLIRSNQRRLNGDSLPPPANADEDLAEIILKACAFEPSMRYLDPADMLSDLQSWKYSHAEGSSRQSAAPASAAGAGSVSEKGTAEKDRPEFPSGSETFYWNEGPSKETAVPPKGRTADEADDGDVRSEDREVVPDKDPVSQDRPPAQKKKISSILIVIGIILIVFIGVDIYKHSDDDPDPVDPTTETTAEAMEAADEAEAATETTEAAAEETEAGDEDSDDGSQNSVWKQYASDFVLWDSSDTYVSLDRIDALSQDQAQTAINEIYARHKCSFNDEEIDAYYKSCSWYSPVIAFTDFDPLLFNPFEWANLISLIPRRSMDDKEYKSASHKMKISDTGEAVDYARKYLKKKKGIDIYEAGLDMICSGQTQNVYEIVTGKITGEGDDTNADIQMDWLVFGDGSIYDISGNYWLNQEPI